MSGIEAFFRDIFSKKSEPSSPLPVPPPKPKPVPQPSDYFPDAIAFTLVNEGPYSNEPADAGGPTNLGITQGDLSKWRGYNVSILDVKNLTLGEAGLIYKAWYWLAPGFDKIKSRKIAICLFDQGVLNGQARSVQFAQLALNNCGYMLTVDMDLGPLTLAALNSVDETKFVKAFCRALTDHFNEIVANNPSQSVFYNGWIARVNRLLTV